MESKKLCYLCFDLGGSYTKYGIITNNGRVLYFDQYQTGEIHSPESLISRFVEIYNMQKANYSIKGIGISTHGVVDMKRGCISYGSNYVKSLVNYPLVSALTALTHLPVVMENDVKAAALSELAFGKNGFKDYIFITLGTSIGGALILNGQLYRGQNNAAGEVGYIITKLNEENKNSLIKGAWESYASAKALLKLYCDAVHNDKATYLMFKQQLAKADDLAEKTLNAYLNQLVPGLASLTHVLAPQAIIIGGAISEDKALIKRVEVSFQSYVLDIYRQTKILPARFGNKSGIIGIVCLLNKNQLNC
ncbi:ROK family protein [Fastidiosibacter lacustris]|uniref:ROK family protein n=1 Tax=Fastidiosibacter lacustris TaxID=2056695 RepID=UPI000E3465FE|nr:ROK family protein [Fastidiosibacter lacustris]